MTKEKSVVDILKAIKLADDALHWLEESKKSLNDAQGLGLWDLVGGKFVVTFLKQRRIRRAENNIARAKEKIRLLMKELEGVDLYVDLNLDMGSLLKFFDYFFGGKIADGVVLARLAQSKAQINMAYDQVLDIRARLMEKL